VPQPHRCSQRTGPTAFAWAARRSAAVGHARRMGARRTGPFENDRPWTSWRSCGRGLLPGTRSDGRLRGRSTSRPTAPDLKRRPKRSSASAATIGSDASSPAFACASPVRADARRRDCVASVSASTYNKEATALR